MLSHFSNMWRSSSSGISGFACSAATHSRYSLFSSSVCLLAILSFSNPEARARSNAQIEPARRQFDLAAAFARDHRHHLLGEDLHLLLDLLGREAAEFEPAEETEVVVAALVAHLHDRVDDVLLGAVD